MFKLFVLLVLLGSVSQLAFGNGGKVFFPISKEGPAGNVGKIYPYNEAAENEYPFTVYIGRKRNNGNVDPLCTGSLVDRRWVLTAAHCVSALISTVVVGDTDRSVDDGSEQIIDITESFIHPDYDDFDLSNDIALLKLASRVIINREGAGLITPLAKKGFFNKMMANEKTCRVAGWGNTYFDNGGWLVPNKLLFQDIRFANTTEAVRRGYDDIPDSHIAGEVKYKNCQLGSICFGDSGGPTFCRYKGEWVQTGITSFLYSTDGCVNGLKGLTNVYYFSSWIQETISSG